MYKRVSRQQPTWNTDCTMALEVGDDIKDDGCKSLSGLDQIAEQ